MSIYIVILSNMHTCSPFFNFSISVTKTARPVYRK